MKVFLEQHTGSTENTRERLSLNRTQSDILTYAWSHRIVLHKIVAKDISPNLKTEDSEMIGKCQ